MIRVLHMIGALEMGGSQALVMNLYRHIDREQIQFDFILDHPDRDDYAAEVKALGGRIFTMPGFHGNVTEIRTFFSRNTRSTRFSTPTCAVMPPFICRWQRKTALKP